MNCPLCGGRITYQSMLSIECETVGCGNHVATMPEPAGGWGHSKPWYAGLIGVNRCEASEPSYARAPIAFDFAEADSLGDSFVANVNAVQFPVARERWLSGGAVTCVGIYETFTGGEAIARVPLDWLLLTVRAGDTPSFAPKLVRVYLSMLRRDVFDECMQALVGP